MYNVAFLCFAAGLIIGAGVICGKGVSHCPVSIGDKVFHAGEGAEVIAIQRKGGGTHNCKVALRYDDRTTTEGYVYGWKVERVD